MTDTSKLTQDYEIQADRMHWVAAAADFVRSIGISVTKGQPSDVTGSFVPGIRIASGGLIVHYETAFPGDILHEAGHLAIIPSQFRPLAQGTLGAVVREMGNYLKENPLSFSIWPEDPVTRGILQSGEAEATAWQYAAAQHLGLPEQWLFPEGSFQGEAAENLERLKYNQYFGINGLQAAGWTRVREMGNPDLPLYPKLKFWLYGGE